MRLVANRAARSLFLGAALFSSAVAWAQEAPAGGAQEAPPGGAPKSLLPDELAPPAPQPGETAAAPAPEGAVPLIPTDQQPASLGPLLAPVVTAELPVPPPAEVLNPLAELAGPTGLAETAGLLTPATGGYGPDLFLGSDARFLDVLLRRIDAPLASRWAQIILTRALLTQAAPPPGLNPADWVAARAAALIAMGSATDAHRMVGRIALDRYTQPLYAVAGQAALAAGDPIGLCPLAITALSITEMPVWELTDAMCSAVLGDDYGASQQFDRLRRGKELAAFDIGLAERIASATGGGRRAANPEWEEVGELTAWRIGLSSAAGLEVPDAFLAAATPAQKGWLVRLPGQPVARRAALAPAVAATGAISAAEANRLFAAEAATLDPAAVSASPGGQLRLAQTAASANDRMDALTALWARSPSGTIESYGWLVTTALAAARIPASGEMVEQAPQIAAALVSAGLTREAARWWRASEDATGPQRAKLWAQLVAIEPSVPTGGGYFADWSADVPAHRAALLSAGLAGLGRDAPDELPPAIDNLWTRALDRAVAARRTGEVMVLVASGIKGGWAEVPPDYLRRIAAALTAVGHAAEARLIVAEAATRG